MSKHQQTFHRAVQASVKIACGTDVGGFEWTTDSAVEFPLMVRDGMKPAASLQAFTLGAVSLLRMQDEVGSVDPGKYADLVALRGDPLTDVTLLEHIDFVLKGDAVYKKNGREVSSLSVPR